VSEVDDARERRREASLPEGARRWHHRILIGLGAMLVLAVVGWQLNVTVWTDHSRRVGSKLVHRARAAQVAALSEGCASASSGPAGLLVVPSIGLVAPVEQGTSNAVLGVAVGHDPYSVWPGANGNAVLEAHDVSYFVKLDDLGKGSIVRYETPCATYDFRVEGHQVVHQGYPVYETRSPTLTLVTCWPINALWFTPDRYLVVAKETGVVRVRPHRLSLPAIVASEEEPTIRAPAALREQGLTLSTYSVPMGEMTITGRPTPAWIESPGPLADQDAAVEAFIGAVRSLTEGRLSWWHDLAPGVAVPQALDGAGNPSYLGALDVAVDANGSRAVSVTLTTTVSIAGGPAPGTYQMTIVDAISNNQLAIRSWSMRAV